MMTVAQALEIVIARTKNERLRQLADPDHPDYDPAWPPYLIVLAESEPAPQGDAEGQALRAEEISRQLANIAKVKACPHFEATSSCGCGYNRCLAGKGRPQDNGVSYLDCFDCLSLIPAAENS